MINDYALVAPNYKIKEGSFSSFPLVALKWGITFLVTWSHCWQIFPVQMSQNRELLSAGKPMWNIVLPQLILLGFHLNEITFTSKIGTDLLWFYIRYSCTRLLIWRSHLAALLKRGNQCCSCICIIKMPSKCHEHTEARLVSAELLRLAQNKNTSKLCVEREQWKLLLESL